MLGVQARIFDPAFFEVSGGGLKDVEHRHFVIRSNVEGFRCAIFKVTPRDPSTALRSGRDDVANRLMFLMVNESARCLEEKVIASPEDADYGMILGTGFPAWRGGPLRFAESFGIKKLVEEMEKLARTNEKYVPCTLLREHAQNGTKFYEE